MTAAQLVSIRSEEQLDRVVLAISGRLDLSGSAAVWEQLIAAAKDVGSRSLFIDLSELSAIDTAGIALLLSVEEAHIGPTSLVGAGADVTALMQRLRTARRPAVEAIAPQVQVPFLRQFSAALVNAIAFLGEVALAAIRLPKRRRLFRSGDFWRYTDQAGVQAIPLVALLGFLIGLILAFQSAIPMRRFGADLYVADLVSISLLRELGPLLCGVILSGRTGSAFAAEIGTMKVNEEVDALTTMGLDPLSLLVLPRLAAALVAMPILTLVIDFAGLVGLAVVMNLFGYPLETVAREIISAARPGDLVQGLIKSCCFGAAIALIGCRAGLSTGVGPRAVGRSATIAVVGGIVASIALDGIFALVLYQMGI